MNDPVATDPDLYRVVFENDRVRVLEYRDGPGDATHLHSHPDSVMVPLANFSRVITADGIERAVELRTGQARWLDAQQHQGSNVGETDSHALFIELKQSPGHTADPSTSSGRRSATQPALGPAIL
jgi:beta-alanine degradation protein BauB